MLPLHDGTFYLGPLPPKSAPTPPTRWTQRGPQCGWRCSGWGRGGGSHMSGSGQQPPPRKQGTHERGQRLGHPVLLYQDTSPAARAVQKELQGAGGAKPMRIMPMHLRARTVPYNPVELEGVIPWPCQCFGDYLSLLSLTRTCQKLDVAVGPQLPRVTTQQTLAAHGGQVQAHRDAVPQRLIHKAERKPGFFVPFPKQHLVTVSNHPSRGTQHTAGVEGTFEGSLATWGAPQGLLHRLLVEGCPAWWGSSPLGSEAQPGGWVVAKHLLTKHTVLVTLLVHACQQHVDLCVRGCSHQHTCAGFGIFLRSPHLPAHVQRS